MNNNKIVYTLKKLISDFFNDCYNFSFLLAIYRAGEIIFRILRIKEISHYFLNKKNVLILEYLKNNYEHVFIKYKNKQNYMDKNSNDAPVWVCWLDGIESAPPLVKRCISSIKNNSGTHPVNIITWENITRYVTLPDYIVEKAKKGIIGLAHFSDILRVCLLAEYGGIWLDSTIYCNGILPEEYFRYSFFSCKSAKEDIGCVSKNQWTTYCLGGFKGNILFDALRDFFYLYWKQENIAIDYLFFDDAIELARKSIPMVRKMIDDVPHNNIDRDKLILRFDKVWKAGCLDDIFCSNTSFFKLGYREEKYLHKYTIDGKPTVYCAFLKEFKM